MSVELDGPGAREYLAAKEGCAPEALSVTALGGGVSNHVLLVESPKRRCVVKQSLGKLRVEQDWFARRDRIWREAEALRCLEPLLPPGSVPSLLYEDRDNYVMAMSAAPGDHSWKAVLMAGEATEAQARTIGSMHRAMLAGGAGNPLFMDLEVFDQLRLDPYYRSTALRHPDLAPAFEAAIERCVQRRTGLVHGDWSPKNLMVEGDRITAIDFEVIHYGDPAFDSGFLLNHLLLKSFHKPLHRALYRRLAAVYWETLQPEAELARGTFVHLPLLLLARVDGKSPTEYITSADTKQSIRGFARELIETPAASPDTVWERLR